MARFMEEHRLWAVPWEDIGFWFDNLDDETQRGCHLVFVTTWHVSTAYTAVENDVSPEHERF